MYVETSIVSKYVIYIYIYIYIYIKYEKYEKYEQYEITEISKNYNFFNIGNFKIWSYENVKQWSMILATIKNYE